MQSSIVIHPHTHFSKNYLHACLAQVFPHTYAFQTQGNGIYVWRGDTEQAEHYLLQILKYWIPTHLTPLTPEHSPIPYTIQPPPTTQDLLRIPLHPVRARELEQTRDFGILHLERLVKPFPHSNTDILFTELHLHCQTIRTLWIATLDQLQGEKPEIFVPASKACTFLQALVGIRLNILLHKNSHRLEQPARLIRTLEDKMLHLIQPHASRPNHT